MKEDEEEDAKEEGTERSRARAREKQRGAVSSGSGGAVVVCVYMYMYECICLSLCMSTYVCARAKNSPLAGGRGWSRPCSYMRSSLSAPLATTTTSLIYLPAGVRVPEMGG